MTTTYTNENKYSGQTSSTYGGAGLTYGELGYMYSGKITTLFTDQTKNPSSFTDLSKNSSTYTNQIKN